MDRNCKSRVKIIQFLLKAHETEIRDSKNFVLMKNFQLIIEFLF